MKSDPVVTVRTADLDEAREVCGAHLYPRSMRLLEPGAMLDARFAFLHLDALTLADIRYGAAVTGGTSELGSYHVNVPQAGHFFASQRGRPIHGGPRSAAVYQPVGDTTLHWSSADCHLHAIKIDRAALEAHLERNLDVRVTGPVRLTGTFDTERGTGRTFAGLARLLSAEIGNADSLFNRPIVAEPVKETLLTALLLAADHQYRDKLQTIGYAGYTPACSIRQVVDAIHEEPGRPHTTASLAAIGGITPGRLRAEFRRQFGVSPMAYLRDSRLLAAHDDLIAANPQVTTVAEVAHRWGFVDVRRFAARFEARFHVTPTALLRRH